MRVDALVIGGGVAGLFTLDALARSGRHALLVESVALGNGQTTSSQGILHAGVKYALGGVAGDDAVEAAAAADRWRGMLGGAAVPELTTVRTLTEHEFLWRTAGFMGAAGMLGARLALRTRPETVTPQERPTWLAGVKGDVLRLAETVVDPRDLLCRLAGLHADRLALGQVRSMTRTDGAWHVDIVLGDAGCLVEARHVILSAGAGNASLLQQAGLAATEPMQRRPLRQAMVRGPLPWVFGHCIDGARTRVTITSDETAQGVIWHV
ncbi:MAG: FAD-dependent oxidoreductase, partial [Phycisphaerales bacterium]